MKTILLSLTYLVGVGELMLSIYFWVTNSKSEIRRVMALLAFSTGMWCVSSALISYTTETRFVDFTVLWVYVFGIFILTSLLHIAVIFPYPRIHFDKLHKLLLYLPAVIFSWLALMTRTVVVAYRVTQHDVGRVVSGPIHHVYNSYLLILFVVIIGVLINKIVNSEKASRGNLLIILLSIIIGGGVPVWLDLILPNLGLQQGNTLYGNIATVVWLGVTTYIVKKK